jgi:hypothetical protein
MSTLQAPYWWHGGTTCHRHCSIAWTGHEGRFVLLKHTGHSEYVDRMSGTQYCETHYALFDMEQIGTDPETRSRSVWSKPELAIATWDGRWTKARQSRMEVLCNPYREWK